MRKRPNTPDRGGRATYPVEGNVVFRRLLGARARVQLSKSDLSECATSSMWCTFTLSEQLTLILNYDYGTQDKRPSTAVRQVAGWRAISITADDQWGFRCAPNTSTTRTLSPRAFPEMERGTVRWLTCRRRGNPRRYRADKSDRTLSEIGRVAQPKAAVLH